MSVRLRFLRRPSGAIGGGILAFVLLASALKLFGASTTMTVIALGVLLLAAPPVWMAVRRSHGLPALPTREPAALS